MKHTGKPTMPPSQALQEEDAVEQAQELSFDDAERPLRAGDEGEDLDQFDDPERVNRAGLTEAAQPGEGPTDDDATPETLLDEDARSPQEHLRYGRSRDDDADDEQLTVRDEADVGLGHGLDEAELAHVKPLDGKPWDTRPRQS